MAVQQASQYETCVVVPTRYFRCRNALIFNMFFKNLVDVFSIQICRNVLFPMFPFIAKVFQATSRHILIPNVRSTHQDKI